MLGYRIEKREARHMDKKTLDMIYEATTIAGLIADRLPKGTVEHEAAHTAMVKLSSLIPRCDACGRTATLHKVVENMMGMDIWFCATCKKESEKE
jgi:hypothetical protein